MAKLRGKRKREIAELAKTISRQRTPQEIRLEAERAMRRRIEKARGPNGVFSAQALKELGVSSPPPNGWIDMLIAKAGSDAIAVRSPASATAKVRQKLSDEETAVLAGTVSAKRKLAKPFIQAEQTVELKNWQVAAKERDRKRDLARRKKMDISNLKVEPAEGRSPLGHLIRVDRKTGPGHLLALHRQQPGTWNKEMLDAAGRFGKDYDLSEYRGLRGGGLEPAVDTSGSGPALAVSVIARERLVDLRQRIGSEYFAMLVLVVGIGFTFTELHDNGLGDKRSLSDQTRTALIKAAAFYSGSRDEPKSRLMIEAEKLIEKLKARA